MEFQHYSVIAKSTKTFNLDDIRWKTLSDPLASSDVRWSEISIQESKQL